MMDKTKHRSSRAKGTEGMADLFGYVEPEVSPLKTESQSTITLARKRKTDNRPLAVEAENGKADKLPPSINAVKEKDEEETALQPSASAPKEGEYDFADLFARLAKSAFRSRFKLKGKDLAYAENKGEAVLARHAADFIAHRLAPAVIPNDGKQTPMRGHPVFLAQHATACCCRGCFAKWHHIPAGRELTPAEQRYAVAVVMEWIRRQMRKAEAANDAKT